MGGDQNKIALTGLRDREVEKIKSESEELDMSWAEYVRLRFRAGSLLWDTNGEFNREVLDSMASGEYEPTQEKPSSSQTGNELIKKTIYNNLSVDEPLPVRDENEDDLVDLLLEEMIIDALEELQSEKKVKNKPMQGWVKDE